MGEIAGLKKEIKLFRVGGSPHDLHASNGQSEVNTKFAQVRVGLLHVI